MSVPDTNARPPAPRSTSTRTLASASTSSHVVAEAPQTAGVATLLMDLLTPGEAAVDAETARLRFDIPLLAGRIVAATDWIGAHLDPWGVGYFGASTGAAAALMAAAERPAP